MPAIRSPTLRLALRRPLQSQPRTLTRSTGTARARFLSTAAENSTQTASSTSRPPFFRRAASATGRALAFSIIGFIMAAAPAYGAAAQVLSPPTDADSVSLFQPSNPDAEEKESFINALPLVAAMRANPDFVESRPHMKIPEAWRSHNLTGGTLAGPGKVVVPPMTFCEKGGKSMVQISHVGTDVCGHAGIIHGGFLATMLDEGLARCCFAALPHNIGMTAKLEIDYKAPALADQYLVLRARTTKVEGRKAWVEGHIETLPASESEEPTVLARASALFISPKQASTMAKIYPVS